MISTAVEVWAEPFTMFGIGINAFAATCVLVVALSPKCPHPLRSVPPAVLRTLPAVHGALEATLAASALIARLPALAAMLFDLPAAFAAAVAAIPTGPVDAANMGAAVKNDSMIAVIKACTMPLYIEHLAAMFSSYFQANVCAIDSAIARTLTSAFSVCAC
jgi:hypothetical protein